jgi:hypothetical protein
MHNFVIQHILCVSASFVDPNRFPVSTSSLPSTPENSQKPLLSFQACEGCPLHHHCIVPGTCLPANWASSWTMWIPLIRWTFLRPTRSQQDGAQVRNRFKLVQITIITIVTMLCNTYNNKLVYDTQITIFRWVYNYVITSWCMIRK